MRKMISSPTENHVVQICTSSISLIGSSTIAIMIFTSPTGLSTPYKRIIFGLSIADIMQSLALVTGPFSPPSKTPQSPWSIGSTSTCETNGFLMTAGSSAVTMYTCSLCIFYLCKLVYRMSNHKFTRRVEIYLHFFIVLFNVCVGMVSLFTKTFNASPLAGFCYFAALPEGCNYRGSYNYGQCERGEHSFTFIFISTISFPLLCLAGVFICMAMILRHAYRKARKCRAEYGQPYNEYISHQHRYESYSEYLIRLYLREAVIQACLYVLGYVAVYIIPFVTCLKMLVNVRSIDNSQFPILMVALFPLGGLYNILVYTRPNISALRRTEPNLSWFKAFLLVIQAGGEVPSTTRTRSCVPCCCFSKQENNSIDNKSSSSLQENGNRDKKRHYYSNQNPPARENQSEVNLASLEGVDSGSLYNINEDESSNDDGIHIKSPNSVGDETGFEANRTLSLERDEEGGNVSVGHRSSYGNYTDCGIEKPVLLIRLQGGDFSNISSICDAEFLDVPEDTEDIS